MTGNGSHDNGSTDDCVSPPPPIPPDLLGRYSFERDPDSEQDIARYVELEADGETVQHVERVKSEFVFGIEHIVWDVTTDKDRYWVITELTNLYSQKHFPSFDYTLSFHVGLMMRMRSRPQGADVEESTPFDEVLRRQEQAKHRLDRAVEAEDFQAVGMVLREALLSLIAALRRRVDVSHIGDQPKDADFAAWMNLLFDALCPGSSNKELRQHLKNTARETWQLVNWLTHDRNANAAACSIADHACDTLIGHARQILERHRTDKTDHCPVCQSRYVRTHFDVSIPPDGDYYVTCASCHWSSRGEAGADHGA
jgi:hypothetical protein